MLFDVLIIADVGYFVNREYGKSPDEIPEQEIQNLCKSWYNVGKDKTANATKRTRFFALMLTDTTITLNGLSERDQATLAEYLRTWNGTRSWMTTHPDCTYESAAAQASAWLKNLNIKAAIEAHLDNLHMSAEEAIQRLSEIARGDIADIMDISSVGFNLDLSKAKEQGFTKLIKKVKQKTTLYSGKGQSDEDREETVLEVELYSAHEALRDILKLKGRFSQRDHEGDLPPVPGQISASPSTLLALVSQIEAEIQHRTAKARAVDTETIHDTE